MRNLPTMRFKPVDLKKKCLYANIRGPLYSFFVDVPYWTSSFDLCSQFLVCNDAMSGLALPTKKLTVKTVLANAASIGTLKNYIAVHYCEFQRNFLFK